MDSIIIFIILFLLISNLVVVIFLLKKKQPEPVNNEQILKDEVNSLRNSFSESFGSMSKEIAKDMTGALTKVDEEFRLIDTEFELVEKGRISKKGNGI